MSTSLKEQSYWSLDLDDFVEQLHYHLTKNQGGYAGRYVTYTGTKEECFSKCLDKIKILVLEEIYASDDYGYRLEST